MLTFSMGNVNTYVKADDTDEDKAAIANLSHCLSYTPKGSGFFKGKNRYKTFSMLYEAKHYTVFPTGLVDFVLNTKHKRKVRLPDGSYGDKFEYYEIKADVIDSRQKPNPDIGKIDLVDDSTGKPLVLHDYQEEAVKAFLKHGRGIIRVSMGGGKTILALAFTQLLNCKTLFIVHTKDLVRQTIRQYKNKAGIDAGMIGDDEWNPKEVTVATIQTLYRRRSEKYVQEFLARQGMVIWDEGHHASQSYQAVSRLIKNAYYRISLSATVGMGTKEEKLKAMSLSGSMIYDVEMKRLVDNKQLAKPTAIFIRIPHMSGDQRWSIMDSKEQYTEGIVHNEFRNMVLSFAVSEMRQRGYPSLLLVEKIAHGENIVQLLKEYDYKVKYVSGNNSADERDDAALELQTREIDILVTSRIFNEGRDLPNLESVIVAAGFKSPSLTFQRAGRGVRKTKLKDTTTYIDCYDEFAPKLKEHSDARLATLKKNKAFDVMVIEWEELPKVLDELIEKRRGEK